MSERRQKRCRGRGQMTAPKSSRLSTIRVRCIQIQAKPSHIEPGYAKGNDVHNEEKRSLKERDEKREKKTETLSQVARQEITVPGNAGQKAQSRLADERATESALRMSRSLVCILLSLRMLPTIQSGLHALLLALPAEPASLPAAR